MDKVELIFSKLIVSFSCMSFKSVELAKASSAMISKHDKSIVVYVCSCACWVQSGFLISSEVNVPVDLLNIFFHSGSSGLRTLVC
jgi:hypothetical protein